MSGVPPKSNLRRRHTRGAEDRRYEPPELVLHIVEVCYCTTLMLYSYLLPFPSWTYSSGRTFLYAHTG